MTRKYVVFDPQVNQTHRKARCQKWIFKGHLKTMVRF